jgi:hypothetical protein
MVTEAAPIFRHVSQSHSLKLMTVIQPPGVQWVVNLLQLNWDMLMTFSLPGFNLKKQMCPWEFHVHDCPESPSTYYMIMESH